MVITILTRPFFYLALLLGVIILTLNSRFPLVGHDHALFIPRLLDSYLFYLKNGLVIQWWTPSFGGGLPSYPNPQQMQLSIQQLLCFFVNPWLSFMITIVIYVSIGYYSLFFVLHKQLCFAKEQAILGATLFSVTGFYIEHMAAGHHGYVSFPLLPFIILLLLAKRFPIPVVALGFGFAITQIIHSAGFCVLVIFGFSIPITLLVISLLTDKRPLQRLRPFLIAATGSILAILLSSSKLVAISSFMRYFPRISSDHYDVSLWRGCIGVVLQLFLTPVALFFKRLHIGDIIRYFTGSVYDLWELDIGLSPMTFIIFVSGITFYAFQKLSGKRGPNNFGKVSYAYALLLLVVSWMAIEFCIAKGYLYGFLKPLPFLRSLRVNSRFTSIFILPLNILTISAYTLLPTGDVKKIWGRVTLPLVLSFIAIGLYSEYIQIPRREMLVMPDFNITQSIEDWTHIRQHHQDYRIVAVGKTGGDSKVFRLQTSSLYPYEPMLESVSPSDYGIQEGLVSEHRENTFNLTNPASMVFPEENKLTKFDRIAISDEYNFKQFINYKPPNWKLSDLQYYANTVSLTTLFGMTIILLYYVFQYVLRKRHRRW